ncbi:MAG: diaminopimelate epimerase [Bauldia sp.]
MTTPIAYRKMNGTGNEILVVDLRGRQDELDPEAVRAIAADPATTFDQLMAIRSPQRPGTDANVLIFNRDGSRAGTCGNGARCVAAVLMEETGRDATSFDVNAGPVEAKRLPGSDRIAVDMGMPRFRWDEVPIARPVENTSAVDADFTVAGAPALSRPSVLSMGNPHVVFFVDDADAYDLATIGPAIENHPLFPDRVNVSIAEVTGPDRIKLRVWERGAGATLACGSAACATAVAAARTGRTGRKVLLTVPGGELEVEWREADGHVILSGPWELESVGELRLPLTEAA